MVSVTNHEVHGFSNSFQHIKSIKSCKLIGQIHFCLQLEKEVLKKCFLAESQRQLWCII